MKRTVRSILCTFLSALCLFAGSCAVNGTVTDFNRQSTDVSKMSFSEPGTLTVLGSDAILEVPISKIKRVSLQSDITRTYDQCLFCLAEVVLKNGDKIGSFTKDRAKAYVAVDRYVLGMVDDASYKILLHNVSRIELDN